MYSFIIRLANEYCLDAGHNFVDKLVMVSIINLFIDVVIKYSIEYN